MIRLLVLTLISAAVSREARSLEGFRIQTTPDWVKVEEGKAYAIFKNRHSSKNEMMVLRKVKLGKNAKLDLEKSTQDVARVRKKLFDEVGLENYFLSSIEKRALKKSVFDSMWVMKAHFTDLNRQTVQMIERQYAAKRTLWSVSYLIDAEFLPNEERINERLDGFVPIKGADRGVASETMALSNEEAFGQIKGTIDDSKPPKELDLSKPENLKQCEFVPSEKRRRRQEPSFSQQLQDTAMAPANCALGLGEDIYGVIRGVADLLMTAFKTATDKAYADQVNVSIGVVVAEFNKDRAGFARRVMSEIFESLLPMKRFQCSNRAEQVKITCRVLAELVSTGALVKFVSKKLSVQVVQETKTATALHDAATYQKTMAANEEVKVGDRNFIRIVPGDEDTTLTRVMKKAQRDDVDVLTQKQWDKPLENGRMDMEGGKLYLAFDADKLFMVPADQGASLAAHEITHATNTVKAATSDLHKARTTFLSAETKLRAPDYADGFRLDELHARTVEVGVMIKKAQELQSTGRNSEALRVLNEASEISKHSKEFQAAALPLLKSARGAVYGNERVFWRNPGDNSVSVKVSTGAGQPPPYKTLSTSLDRDGTAVGELGRRTDGATLTLHVPEMADQASRKKALELIDVGIKDTQRFTKTMAAQDAQIAELRTKMQLPADE